MTNRESQIRALVSRLSQSGSGVGPEYSLLSLDDTRFLLMEIDGARGELKVRGGEDVEVVYDGYACIVKSKRAP